MTDLFDKISKNRGPLGMHAKESHGYFTFPKLEGEISNRMIFRSKEKLVWSLNNYLGLANHPEVRKIDGEASVHYGLGTPMGARMMSGETDRHTLLEQQLAAFEQKEDAILLNYGYQGMVSAIDRFLRFDLCCRIRCPHKGQNALHIGAVLDIDEVNTVPASTMRCKFMLRQQRFKILGQIGAAGQKLNIIFFLWIYHRSTAQKSRPDVCADTGLAAYQLRVDLQARF